MKKKNPYQFGNTDEDIVDGSLYEYESENYVPVDTEAPDAGPDTSFIAEKVIESSLAVGSVASEGTLNNAQATYQARTNEPQARVRDEDLKSLVEHIPSGSKLDVQSLHEDMVLAERELSKSEGYIASAGQSRSAYQQYLKNEFQGLNSKDFDALPKPNEVEFGSQSQAREYTDYYDLRGYNHHKTISYYTNAEDQQMRLQEASAHINNFEDRLRSDARYASMAKHIDRQCQNMGITEDQRQEMEAQAEKDFIQSGAIDNSKGVISAWEMNQRGVSKDQADLHKLRCQREEMVRDGQANSDEYKELMNQIEEQRKEVFLDPIQTQEEALEQLKEQDRQEQAQEVQSQEIRPEEHQAQELQYEEFKGAQSQGDLIEDQPEETTEKEEQIELTNEHLQAHDRPVEAEEKGIEKDVADASSNMDSADQERNREEVQQAAWDRHSDESIFVEAQQEEMDEEALEAQRIVRQQELASMRSSSDSAAMGGEQIDDSYQLEQELVEYDLDEDEEFDIDESLEIEEAPELVADNSEEIAQQVEADKDFERELAELAGEYFGDQQEEYQEKELGSDLESEFEMESEPGADPTEADNEIEEEAHPFNQELEDAFQAAMESEDMLEFEKNGGLTAEQEMELDALLDDLGGQQEERELGIDMDDENERDNEFSR